MPTHKKSFRKKSFRKKSFRKKSFRKYKKQKAGANFFKKKLSSIKQTLSNRQFKKNTQRAIKASLLHLPKSPTEHSSASPTEHFSASPTEHSSASPTEHFSASLKPQPPSSLSSNNSAFSWYGGPTTHFSASAFNVDKPDFMSHDEWMELIKKNHVEYLIPLSDILEVSDWEFKNCFDDTLRLHKDPDDVVVKQALTKMSTTELNTLKLNLKKYNDYQNAGRPNQWNLANKSKRKYRFTYEFQDFLNILFKNATIFIDFTETNTDMLNERFDMIIEKLKEAFYDMNDTDKNKYKLYYTLLDRLPKISFGTGAKGLSSLGFEGLYTKGSKYLRLDPSYLITVENIEKSKT